MTDYQFRYRLESASEAANDGSGACKHDIYAEFRKAGSSDEWVIVPGRHKTIVVPAAELQTVMDMPQNNATVRAVKNAAYKQALSDNLNTQADPVTGWTSAQMEAAMDANDAATVACAASDCYLIETLGLDYPIPFNI